jgi:voltage-gated potassium channel
MTRRPSLPMVSMLPGGEDEPWGTTFSGRQQAWTKMDTSSSPEYTEPSFWKRSSVKRILGGFLALGVVISYGVLGYILLGWNAFDALYMVVITVSGVGFGEVRPMVSTWTRIHTMFLITFGIVAVAYTLAGFVQFITEGEIHTLLGLKRVRRHIETLTDHVIIAGFGRMGSLICEELASAGEAFVLIERSGERAGEFERRGYLYIIGNATDEKVLLDAGLNRAKALVSVVPTDAENVFITLTARELVPNVQIVARAEHPSTQKKLHQAGANHVVLPAAIGAHRITSLLTNPSAVEFVELVTKRSSLAIEMNEFPIEPASQLSGLTLRDADIGRRTGVIVIALKRANGTVEFPPTGNETFTPGDIIVVIGRRGNLDQFRRQFCARTKQERPAAEAEPSGPAT